MGYLVNNPHNPTGLLFPLEALVPLLETGKPVVVDEAFMDFLPPQDQPSLIPKVADYPNLVVLRSLTKFYSLPGVRIGYAIAHPDRLQRWQRWRDPWPVNTLAEAATLAALQDKDFQGRTWQWLPPTRQDLLEGLKRIAGLHSFESTANFLLVRSEAAVPLLQTQLLQQHQILIRDCLSFPELGEYYFRIAVRTEDENAQLLRGLTQILTNNRS
jgi:histidinol-phosphate/aromatic aminotransferase/cobyric acid decarboxylase-like protein